MGRLKSFVNTEGMPKHAQATAAIVLCLFWLIVSVVAWLHPAGDFSMEERRKLADRPVLERNAVLRGSFMNDFEAYAKDRFPFRFAFRSLKARVRFDVLRHLDNNDIYVVDGYAAKLAYPLNEPSVEHAVKTFGALYDTYMRETDVSVYVSVIPDKNYYLAGRKGYPSLDYERLFAMIREGMDYAQYIDIAPMLSLEDFYRSDIHWRQERLGEVAGRIAESLGVASAVPGSLEHIDTGTPLAGVYRGQSALPLLPDRVVLVTNDSIEKSRVFNWETGIDSTVYDMEKLTGRDPYDVFLSGATPLLIIENPTAHGDRELVVFRDSFASSLVPWLLDGYARVVLIDIRYMSSSLVGEHITFSDQDVLFLYNALLFNAANVLK